MYHRDACISLFIATLFTIVKLEKNLVFNNRGNDKENGVTKMYKSMKNVKKYSYLHNEFFTNN